jgi:hypothetical protein
MVAPCLDVLSIVGSVAAYLTCDGTPASDLT